jgi:hypothetical protein
MTGDFEPEKLISALEDVLKKEEAEKKQPKKQAVQAPVLPQVAENNAPSPDIGKGYAAPILVPVPTPPVPVAIQPASYVPETPGPKTKDGWKSALSVAVIFAGSMTLIGQIIEHFKNKPEPETVSRSYVGSSSNSGTEENANSDIGPIRYRVLEDNSGGNNSRLEKKADSDSRAKQAKQYDAVYLDDFRKAVELNPGSVVAKGAPETSVIEPSSVQKELFSMAELADCYRISGVKYRNDVYVVDVSKALLENGAEKTQDGWIAYSKNALSRGGLIVGSLPQYHAVFSELAANKNDPKYSQVISSLLAALNKPIRNSLTTLTRIKYNRSSTDLVIHNVGMPDQYTLSKDIYFDGRGNTGMGYFTPQIGGAGGVIPGEICDALFGSADTAKTGLVYESLFNHFQSVGGFSHKICGTKESIDAVVLLGAISSRIGVTWQFEDYGGKPAWGVRFTKK